MAIPLFVLLCLCFRLYAFVLLCYCVIASCYAVVTTQQSLRKFFQSLSAETIRKRL